VFDVIMMRLAPGTDDAWLAAETRVQTEVAYHQPGFLRRMVGRHDDGRWMVIQMWDSPEHAASGARAIDASPAGSDWRALALDVSVEHFVGV
jgi:hypothetical protein